LLPSYLASQLLQRCPSGFHDSQPASVEKTAPDLERGSVERQWCILKQHLITIEFDVIAINYQSHNALMPDADTLW